MSLRSLGFASVVISVAAVLLATIGIPQRVEWDPALVLHGGGNMYVVPVLGLTHLEDSNESPQRSPLRLHENGRKLGPAHSGHVDIIASGAGRFSHFSSHIYFSASDNSDVRSNGRKYWASYYWKLHPAVAIALVVLSLLLLRPLRPGQFVRRWDLAAWTRVDSLAGVPARGRRSWLRVSTFLLAAAALMSALLSWSGIERTLALDNHSVVHVGGRMYAYDLRELESSADTSANPQRSNLVLLEDMRRLGPAHSMHAEISKEGAGRFSHFSQFLYFSSSDNIDVKSNGRTYTAVSTWRLTPLVPALLGLLALASLVSLAVGLRASLPGRPALELFTAALRDSRAHYLVFGFFLVLAVHLGVQFFASPESAATELDLLRRVLRRVVGAVLTGASAVLLLRAVKSKARVTDTCALAIVLLAIGVFVSDRPRGFPIAVAVIAALLWQFARKPDNAVSRYLTRAVEACERHAALDTRKTIWMIASASAAVTLVNVVPEVVRYWDQSGWMDSRFYDFIAHDIARGSRPLGHSEYAPVYQYFLAFFYWTFGHLFFVQQIANLALACATAVMMCWAAWFFFGRMLPVACMGVVVAYLEPLHHAVWYTQIENLYVPLFAASILALGRYFRRRDWTGVILLAVTGALVFATRQQGAFYVAALGLAVLVVRDLTLKARVRQMAVYGVVVAALGILPWSARNWHVEGRFSPSTAQAASLLAVLNDPRIPFHAIRYWERSAEVRAEWAARYPDPGERHRAMQEYFRHRLLNETEYFVAAAPWRLAAFYGFLPGAYVGVEYSETRQVGFFSDWLPHLRARTDLWGPVALSLVALAWRIRSRVAWFLFLLIAANAVVSLLVGSAEPRGCYPVLLLHLALGLSLLTAFRLEPESAGTAPASGSDALPVRRLAFGVLWIALGASALHIILGLRYQYREVPGVHWLLQQDVKIDRSLPLFAEDRGIRTVDGKQVNLEPGKRYRSTFVVTLYMFPPRFMKGLAGLEPSLALPQSVQYYIAKSGWPGSDVPVRYEGARATAPLRELDLIEVEFVVDAVNTPPWTPGPTPWLSIEKAVVIGERRSPQHVSVGIAPGAD